MGAESEWITDRQFMIAANRNSAKFPAQFDYLIRVGAVVDKIAEIPDSIVPRRGSENRFEGLQICVDI
jgi:hypothetical protein